MNGEGPECQCVLDRSGLSEHTIYMSLIDVEQGLSKTHTHTGAAEDWGINHNY